MTAMNTYDPKALDRGQLYNLITTSLTPRPVAWVSTINSAGQRNLAAFSYFNGISTMPPLLAFSVGVRRDGSQKDTLNNLRALPECVVHIADEAHLAQVEISGTEFPSEIDEFNEAHLESVASQMVKPPRVASAAIAFECKAHEIHPLPAGSKNTLVIAEILLFHVRADLINAQYGVDVLKLNPIARLGGKDFGLLGRVANGQTLMDEFLQGKKA
jgi:flavin reductase (DIM6/NTAB) family NADH-FMN oxidoreductase RutF